MANELEAMFNQVVNSFKEEINEALEEACNEVAHEAEEKLHETSPARSGDYAKGWTVERIPGRSTPAYEVKNATHYRLTHLLENGHDIVVNGKKYGRVKPHKHIKQVERWCQEELPKRLEEKLNDN